MRLKVQRIRYLEKGLQMMRALGREGRNWSFPVWPTHCDLCGRAPCFQTNACEQNPVCTLLECIALGVGSVRLHSIRTQTLKRMMPHPFTFVQKSTATFYKNRNRCVFCKSNTNLMDFRSEVNLKKKKKKRLLLLVDLKNKLKPWRDLWQGQTRGIGPASLSR